MNDPDKESVGVILLGTGLTVTVVSALGLIISALFGSVPFYGMVAMVGAAFMVIGAVIADQYETEDDGVPAQQEPRTPAEVREDEDNEQ